MDDASGVGFFQSGGDLDGRLERGLDFQTSFPDFRPQRIAIDELTDDEMMAIELANLINRENVWMVQRGSCACLLLKAAETILVGGERR
jgi:hypothetical protein